MPARTFLIAGLSGPFSLLISACDSNDASNPTELQAEAVTIEAEPDGTANDVATASEILPMTSPIAAAPKDLIRSKGGLEDKCIAKVNVMTGGNAIGTNRIEESEAATAIYVNVQGADAPWRCLAYPRTGTIGDVMYTGSEGAL